MTNLKKNISSISPLTPKEKAVLEFIETFMKSSGVSPSYQEIMDNFGLASFNSVQNYLKQLTAKGYVELPAHQKRAIRILRTASAVQDELNKGYNNRGGETFSLPLMGRVAAGRPIERMSHDEYFEVASGLVKRPDSTFVLQVEGDSMIDDGIWDGDFLLIEKRLQANNGDIIVASVEDEATVKRFYKRPHPDVDSDEPWVELRPSNPRLKSMWYQPQQVDIKGLVVGLVRKY